MVDRVLGPSAESIAHYNRAEGKWVEGWSGCER